MDDAQRDHFDEAMERVLDDLPQQLRDLLEEVPLIVEDYPSPEICEEFDLEYRDELCGLHDGVSLTDRSVDGGTEAVPDHIMIYREGIMAMAEDDDGGLDDAELAEQIRITVLHEIGHHFGLSEQDLEKLGYD